MPISYATSTSVLVIALLFATTLLVARREYELPFHVRIWSASFAMLALSHACRVAVLEAPASESAWAYLARAALIASVGLLSWGFLRRRGLSGRRLGHVGAVSFLILLAAWLHGGVPALAIGRFVTSATVTAMIVTIVRSLSGAGGITLIVKCIASAYGLYMALMAGTVWIVWLQGAGDGTFQILTLVGMPVVTVAAGIVVLLVLVSDLAETLRDLALVDPLTQVLNRRGLAERLCAKGASPHVGLVVVAADLDKFKAINDRLGHAVGDRVLVSFAAYLKAAAPDFQIARVGGEEFLLVACGMSLERAAQRAEDIRRGISATVDHGAGCVTASFGVAVGTCAGPWDALAEQADQALYQAKHGGRDRVVTYIADARMPKAA